MTELHTASALGTLMGHIQQIRISYEHGNPDLGARLERLFAEAERIEREREEAVRMLEAMGVR